MDSVLVRLYWKAKKHEAVCACHVCIAINVIENELREINYEYENGFG
jgi:hypothetical protein